MKTEDLQQTKDERITSRRETEDCLPALSPTPPRPPSKAFRGLRRGERIAHSPWLVRKPLGRGGIGEVYEVEHALLGRSAALKIMHDGLASHVGIAETMADEARHLASIRHPNLVDVLDLGVLDEDGRPYLILELLDGRDLGKEMKRLRLFSVRSAIEIVCQALKGLGALHQAGLVHRDIKLENVFLCADGSVKIIDLGAAESLKNGERKPRPSLGTPRVMPPEQAAGKPVDERADLYAMGLVLYELIAGRGPFDDIDTPEAMQWAHAECAPKPPSAFAEQPIPKDLDTIVLRALEKVPDHRFPSAEAMRLELEVVLERLCACAFDQASRGEEQSLAETMPSAELCAPSPLGKTILSPQPKQARAFQAAAVALAMAALALGISVGRLVMESGDERREAAVVVGR